MKKSLILLLAFCLFVSVSAAFAEADTWKIAVPCPLTGDAANFGEMIMQGVNTAVKEINEAGGVNGKLIEAVPYDDKCDATEGAAVSSRIVADKDMFAVIGHQCSGATLSGAPNYERARLVYFTPASSRDDLCSQGFKYLFRSMTKDSGYAPIIADIALDHLCAKKIAIMYSNNDYGTGLRDSIQAEMQARGAEVVACETFKAGDRDFSAQLTKIASLEADCLILAMEYTEGALVCRQREAAGLGNVPVVASSTNNFPQFIEIGGEGVEGAIVGAAWDRWSTNPVQKAFNDKWIELYGEPADELSSYYYDAVYLMKQAIEEGATRETLVDYMHNMHFEGVTGITEFDETGEIMPKDLFAIQVKDGQFVSYDMTAESTCEK